MCRILIVFAALLTLTTGGSAGNYCLNPASDNFERWVNAGCGDSVIAVEGPTSSGGSVSITWNASGNGGAGGWDISVSYNNAPDPGDAESVTIIGLSTPRPNVSKFRVSFGSNAPHTATATLRFDDSTINHVDDIGYGDNVDGLSVGGLILGDLGGAAVSEIGLTTALSDIGLTVEGDVTGNIMISGAQTKGGPPIYSLTVFGNVLGNITVANGGIRELIVDGTLGIIGPGGALTPISVTTTGAIDRLIAGDIVADIVAGSSASADIGLVRATTLTGGDGNFVGSLAAKYILEEIDIQGDLGAGTSNPAVIEIDDPLQVGITSIRVWGDFRNGSEIILPANGVPATFSMGDVTDVSMILLNAENTGGAWEAGAAVVVGATELDTPDYSEFPSSFGSGAVAIVPFRRHADWSFPVAGGQVAIRETDPASVTDPPGCRNVSPVLRIRTYGPVYRDGTGALLKVSRRTGQEPVTGDPIWTDVTSDFAFDLPTAGTHFEITVEKIAGAWTKGDYRLEYDRTLDVQSTGNGTAAIRCSRVTGNPRMASFVHLFSTRDTCGEELLMMFDLTADDDLCMQDVAEWTANPVDFNGDNTICSQDMAMLLQAIDNFHAH